jgi:uridine nucleosidase
MLLQISTVGPLSLTKARLISVGDSGLDGTDLLPKPERSSLVKCNAILEMYHALIRCPPNTAWLVATGALTNIALLFAIYPTVSKHIRGLSIMAGSIGDGFTPVPLGPAFRDAQGQERPRIGNITPYAEFNVWCDPEAAQSIFRNADLIEKIVLIPLDVTHQAFAGQEVQDMLLHGKNGAASEPTRLRKIFNELLMFFAHTYANVFGLTEGPPLHDPLAIAVLLADYPNPDVKINFNDGGGERWNVDIVLAGEEVGRTIIKVSEAGVTVPRSLDMEKFWVALEDCMACADDALNPS